MSWNELHWSSPDWEFKRTSLKMSKFGILLHQCHLMPKIGLIIWMNWAIQQAAGRPETMSTRELRGGVLCSVNVCVWNHTLQETFPACRVSKCVCVCVSVCMSAKHHKSTFILSLSHNRMRYSILSRVCLVRQWRRTWTACNLVADGFSKSQSSDVPHATERYKNLQLENTHVVEIQLPDKIEFRNQSLKCVRVCSCFLCKFNVPLLWLLLTCRKGRWCRRRQQDCRGRRPQ